MERVDDGLDGEIDGMADDFAMRLKEGTLAALDRTRRDVKRLSDSMPKVNYWQPCFESVVLSVRVGVSEVLITWIFDTTGHDDGW